MTISVAVAAYRGEKYIGEQLASIAAQSRMPDEVVICDDSLDNLTEKAIMGFTGLLNIRYFRNETALGAAANFNRALSLCTGDVIFLCDQDDLWYPEKVAKMCKYLTAGEISAVFCDSDITDKELHPQNFTHLESRGYGRLLKEPDQFHKMQFLMSCRRFPAAGHDMAFTREFLKKVLPIPDLKNCHDNFLGVAGAALDAWVCVPESLGVFRRHEGSTSSAGRRMSLAEQWRVAGEALKNRADRWNEQLFSAVLDRLPDLSEERRVLLKERIVFSRSRADLPKEFFRRLPAVISVWRSGNYHKFGRGWKNIVQDLFLR